MKSRTTTITITRRLVLLTIVVAIATTIMLLAARPAHAFTQVAPADGTKVPWMQLRPAVAFDVADDESPKWALLSENADMSSPVRYCRQFGSAWIGGGWHWGCDAWSIGTDNWGNDVIRNLEWGKTYFLQVTWTDADGKDQTSTITSFSVDLAPTWDDPNSMSDTIWGTVMGDGTNLNLGAAAFVNSGLKVTAIKSGRLSTNRFQFGIGYTGGIDLSRSYIRITSKAGKRYIPLAKVKDGSAKGIWLRSKKERKMKKQVYRYQAFLKSTKNGSLVRSEVRVIVIKHPPKWKRT